MERALELAEAARGKTHPNPAVGAVLVRDGRVVGEGATAPGGRPHAETVALAQAGEAARGATLYVTLEPCSHHGRTPPCADAVIAAGVARVVVAATDPNPEVAGLARLRAAGIEVELAGGALAARARRQNEAWRTWIAEGRPFVLLKAAVTLDGRLTVPEQRWVSGEASRRLVHELRAEVDAVAVGMGTAIADRPRLTAREVAARRQPRRLVFGRGPLPEGLDLELVEDDPPEALARLAAEGVQSLLLEGGPRLAARFLELGLVDKLLLFVAPLLAGAGPSLVEDFAGGPLRTGALEARPVGDDVLLTAYLHEP